MGEQVTDYCVVRTLVTVFCQQPDQNFTAERSVSPGEGQQAEKG